MEHSTFFLLNMAALGIIYWIDRKDIRTHLGLGLLAFLCAIVFAIIPIPLVFYHAEPRIIITSPPTYSFLLCFPFISYSYFIAGRVFGIKWNW